MQSRIKRNVEIRPTNGSLEETDEGLSEAFRRSFPVINCPAKKPIISYAVLLAAATISR